MYIKIAQDGPKLVIATLCIVVSLFFCPLFSTFAMTAGDGHQLLNAEGQTWSFAVNVSNAVVNGGGREFVYTPELADMFGWDYYKMSDLRWESRNVWMLGGNISGQYLDWVTLNLGYWKKMTSGSGVQTDDDWMVDAYGTALDEYGGTEPIIIQTNYSEGRSEVDKGAIFDVNSDIRLIKFMQERLGLFARLGYKTENWKWKEYDSNGLYFEASETTVLISDDVLYGNGMFWNSEGTMMTYEQEIDIPYLGVGANYTGPQAGLSLYALYSRWGKVEATDHHIARSLKTVDSFSDVEYWSLGLSARWYVRPHWTLTGTVEFEDIPNVVGDSAWFFEETPEENQVIDAGAGTGYSSTTFGISVSYDF